MWTFEIAVAVTLIFLFAGFVKGVSGIGLPTFAIALMAVFVGLKEGVALMVAPTVVTNVWQALSGGRLMALTRRFWTLLITVAVGAWIGGSILAQADATLLAAFLGGLLFLYSLYSLLTPQIPPPGRAETWLSPVIGATGGVIGGMTGSYAVPGVVYMQALGMPRDMLVQALGITFVVFTVTLGSSLVSHGLLSSENGMMSVGATIPAVIGMAFGQRFRHRLSEEMFRQVFFMVLLVLGAWLIVSAVL